MERTALSIQKDRTFVKQAEQAYENSMEGFNLRTENYLDIDAKFDQELGALLSDIYSLYELDCLRFDSAVINTSHITPSKMMLNTTGLSLCVSMGLYAIPLDDVQKDVIHLISKNYDVVGNGKKANEDLVHRILPDILFTANVQDSAHNDT